MAEQSEEIASLRAERDNLLWRNRLLRQRPDLPADRIPAHAEMERLQAENVRLRERVDRLEWALMHPTTADAEALRSGLLEAALSGSSKGDDHD